MGYSILTKLERNTGRNTVGRNHKFSYFGGDLSGNSNGFNLSFYFQDMPKWKKIGKVSIFSVFLWQDYGRRRVF